MAIITVSVTDIPSDPDSLPTTWPGLPLDPAHARGSTPDSLFAVFAASPASRDLAARLPLTITAGKNVKTGTEVLNAFFTAQSGLKSLLDSGGGSDADRSLDVALSGGSDGNTPASADYEGSGPRRQHKTGLTAFEDLDDISIVAAPGLDVQLLQQARRRDRDLNVLIAHAEKMRYRIAVLDCGDQMAIADVRRMRGQLDSTLCAPSITRG